MHFNRLDLNLLVAFDALMEECSITRAGERLHLSQPAVSGALARLREYFGDQLLTQVGRKMIPTPLAISLQPRIRSILMQIQATVETRPTFDPATAFRHFRVAASDYVVSVLLVQLLAQLAKIAPGITIELLSMGDKLEEAMNRGEVDLMVTPKEYLNTAHCAQELFVDDFVCAVWQGNSIIGETITKEEYQQVGHIGIRFGNISRATTVDERLMAQKGLQRRYEVFAYDFNTAVQLLLGTNRILTSHRKLAEYYAQMMPLRILPLPFALSPLREYITWHKYQDNDLGNIWLREFMVTTANTSWGA